MKKVISVLTILFFAFSCSSKVVDIKSPCVSEESGPCGLKKPINDWWLKNSSQKQKINS
jgi:hypothetical protein